MADQKNKSRYKAAVLIASDRSASGERLDRTGPKLRKRLTDLGYVVSFLKIVPDNKKEIMSVLRTWVWDERIHLILISGGTGLAEEDVTPEATLEIIERRIPGMEEAMRQASLKRTPFAMLSRAVVGSASKSLVVNLPGNPDGALENLQVIEPALMHALALINGEKPDP